MVWWKEEKIKNKARFAYDMRYDHATIHWPCMQVMLHILPIHLCIVMSIHPPLFDPSI